MGQRGKSTDKPERIIAAAVKVFAAKGFYRARVSDVAREAGVADGTIYLYFSSKEELLHGLFEEKMRAIIVRLTESVADAGSPVVALARLVDTYVAITAEDPDLAEVLTVEIRESGKFMKEFAAPLFGEFLRIIIDVVEEGQRTGVFKTSLSGRTVARAMFGAMDELALAWVMSNRKWDLKEAAREVLGVFISGMGDPASGNLKVDWSSV